jgi:Glycosyltransferases involved in cell wall biogenesis
VSLEDKVNLVLQEVSELEQCGKIEEGAMILLEEIQKAPENKTVLLEEMADLYFRNFREFDALLCYKVLYSITHEIELLNFILSAYYEPNKAELEETSRKNIKALKEASNYYGKIPDCNNLPRPLWHENDSTIYNFSEELIEVKHESYNFKENFYTPKPVMLINELDINNIDMCKNSTYNKIYLYYDESFFLLAIQLIDFTHLSKNYQIVLIYGEDMLKLCFCDSLKQRPDLILGQNSQKYSSLLSDTKWPVNYIYHNYKYDFNLSANAQLPNGKELRAQQDKIVFSVLMCVYNDVDFFNSAVNSLINQTFGAWELIILDNGSTNENAWRAIEHAVELDDRIIGIRGKENVGWAKGASICLKKARGAYMTFLAADDCLHPEALQWVYNEIQKNVPEIIWVGNAYVRYVGKELEIENVNVPMYRHILKDATPGRVEQIIQTVYYNSFFHYVNIEFLNKNNIDFFEPYYADCAGMTHALCQAENMVVLNKVVYYLTIETSQSRGNYLWDCYKHIFSSQWNSIMERYKSEGYYNRRSLNYVVKRIENNHLELLKAMCEGARCRNRLMNDEVKNFRERFKQLEDTLSDENIVEMMNYYGRDEFSNSIFELMIKLFNTYMDQEFSDMLSQCTWLKMLCSSVFEIKNKNVEVRSKLSEGNMNTAICAVINEKNKGSFGYELVVRYAEQNDCCYNSMQVSDALQPLFTKHASREKERLLNLIDNFYVRSNLQKKYYTDFFDELKDIYNNIKMYLEEIELVKLEELIYGPVS